MCIEYQVTTVRLQEHTTAHHPKVGQECAHLCAVFDLADQVWIARVWFIDHRRRNVGRVIHDQVDLVSRKEGGGITLHEWQRGLRRFTKLLRVLDDVLLRRFEVVGNVRYIGVTGLEFPDQRVDRVRGDFLVERPNTFMLLLAQLRQAFDTCLQFFAQLLDCRLQLLTLFLRQGLEFLVVYDLAFAGGRKHVAGRRLQHGDVFLRRLFPDAPPELFDFLLGLGLDSFQLVAVIIVFEDGRNRYAHLFDQGIHIIPKLCSPAGRQAQCARALRVRKVVRIAPVIRGTLVFRPGPGQLLGEGMPVATDWPEYEDIVIGALHPDAEEQGFHGTLLTQAGQLGPLLFGRLQFDLRQRFAACTKLVRGNSEVAGVV